MPVRLTLATVTLAWGVTSGFGVVHIGSHATQHSPGANRSEGGRSFADLREAVPQMTAASALKVRCRWLTDDPVENPTDTINRFQIVSVDRARTRITRERSPQVSSASLVVISHDSSGRELDWRIVADPRIVRSEGGTAPMLDGQSLYYLDAHLNLTIPDLPDIALLSVYKVRSRDGEAMLDLVGTIDLLRP